MTILHKSITSTRLLGDEMGILKRYIFIKRKMRKVSPFRDFLSKLSSSIDIYIYSKEMKYVLCHHPRIKISFPGFADYSKQGNSASVFRATSSRRISWLRMASNKSYRSLPDFTGANREYSSICTGG